MGEGEETIELRFRIYDGTDIGQGSYALSLTAATLKQKLVAEWPRGLSFAFFFGFNSFLTSFIL